MAGLRERKKAQTRRRLADTAFALFRERGYENVTVAQIADAAEVAVSTLFAYFPCKEALVFDAEDEYERALTAAVRDRAPGVSLLDALEAHLVPAPQPAADDPSDRSGPSGADFVALVRSTPALLEYAGRLRRRWEASLAAALAREAGVPEGDLLATTLARFALEANFLATYGDHSPEDLKAVFERLRHGWSDFGVTADRNSTA
ncbi:MULTISPECIES: TetR/AcrR family transcriptional regulator [Streptomyces]|uniref:TetR family transcriptional regulator n=2 Tax=Streptomyces TaxID=1883 RepID=A0A2U9P7F8_STRAS|nr:TetR/AcrR family transcriptional regulator [Streptomyces actuosus]AWT45091.1 TetR family transcriptional regulator [Streptomyces actuosus]MBM4821665.1 TetR family transcriptional regulator [Streptomyces actuosus]